MSNGNQWEDKTFISATVMSFMLFTLQPTHYLQTHLLLSIESEY